MDRWRLVIIIALFGIVGNIIFAVVLASADASGNTSLAQSVSIFRQIYNTIDVTLFIIALLFAIFGSGSAEE